MSIRLLLADDHNVVRSGMRSLLEREPDLEVIGEVASGREAVLLAKKLRPDIVLMDVTMPDLNGVEATRQINAEVPEVKVIGLSMHSRREFVEGMLQAGAAGYQLKSCSIDDLCAAIRAVAEDKVYLDPNIAGLVVEGYRRHLEDSGEEKAAPLSPREREVLQLVAEGLTSKEIADRLFLSSKTVALHRQQIMSKLGIRTVAGLTKYAIKIGLSGLEL